MNRTGSAPKPHRLALLGGFQLEDAAGTRLRLPTRKAEALLAYLVIEHPRTHPRESLAALLWADSPADNAGASLRQTLFLLGKVLGNGVILRSGRHVGIAQGALDTDVARFAAHCARPELESLQLASDLYRSEFLAGLNIDEPTFDEWSTPQRQRLHELAIDAQKRLVDLHCRDRDTENAIRAALRLTVLDPLDEATHRLLMDLHARSGRRGAALRLYRACVGVLRRELGTDPHEATQRLYRDILQHRVGPSVTEGPRAPRSRQTVAEPDDARRSDLIERAIPTHALIGRAGDLTALREALDAAARHEGRVVMLLGEVGIGKTTLLTAAAMEANRRGFHALLGRAHESEQVLAFSPWIDAIRSGGPLADAALEGMEGIWRIELARLFPQIEVPGAASTKEDYRRLFQSICALIDRLAARAPLAVLLDDLQWADDMSLRLLPYLARHIAQRRVFVLGTARNEDMHETRALSRTLDELRAERHFRIDIVKPLSSADTAVLVRSLTKTPTDKRTIGRLEERMWRLSKGNPFFIVETVRALDARPAEGAADRLPIASRLAETISARLDRLSRQGQELTALAAAIGQEFDFALLARASGLSSSRAARVIEELVRRRILHDVGEQFDFVHDQVRQVAYGRILAPRRRVFHLRLGRALETSHGGALDAYYARLAHHFEQGHAWAAALRYLKQAGAQAATRSAYREAAQLVERALACLEHLLAAAHDRSGRRNYRRLHIEAIDLRLMLRNCLLPLLQHQSIIARLREAEAIAQQLGERGKLAKIQAYLCRDYYRIADIDSSVAAGRRALALAKSTRDLEVQVAANLYLGVHFHALGQYEEALEHLRTNLALLAPENELERFGLPYLPAVFTRVVFSWCLADLGEFDEGFRAIEHATKLATEVNQPWDLLATARAAAILHLGRGELDDAIRLLERCRSLCESADIPGWAPNVLGHLGYAYALTNRVAPGIDLMREAVAMAQDTRTGHETRLRVFLAEALIRARHCTQALQEARTALDLARSRKERAAEALALHAFAAASAEENPVRAKKAYLGALDLAQRLGLRPLAAHCHLGVAELSRAGRESDAAGRHAREAAETYMALGMQSWRRRAEHLAAMPRTRRRAAAGKQ